MSVPLNRAETFERMSRRVEFDDCALSLAGGPSLGLYIHFPYCRHRCSYCDFNAHVTSGDRDTAYTQYHKALMADIVTLPKARIRTVFWGGGTPSLMPLQYLLEAMKALDQKMLWTEDLENTLEVNPGTMDQKAFRTLRDNGWNRLSIGAQAFQAHLLELVGRAHSAEEIESTFQDARRAGFDNLSLDLIYGFPQQTLEHWKETLRRALALEPEHLSVYCLTIEPSTRLEKQLAQGELQLPDEEVREAMDDLAIELLEAEGFYRYEVSNWSRPGKESRHNCLYWTNVGYLGAGCGAVSYYNGWRQERIKPPAYYQKALEQGRSPIIYAERRDLDGTLKDNLMMGLRVADGVTVSALRKQFPGLEGEQIEAFFQTLPSTWWKGDGDRYWLTRQGWDFHSEVAMKLMDVLFEFPRSPTSTKST